MSEIPRCAHPATRCVKCGEIRYADPFDALLSPDQQRRKWEDEHVERLIRDALHEPREGEK